MNQVDQQELTVEQYLCEGMRRFGKDITKWKFVCPACGHVASVQDYKNAGAPEGAVGHSCIGRWTGANRSAFGEAGPGPCDYAGGGLFTIAPVIVEGMHFFAFAD